MEYWDDIVPLWHFCNKFHATENARNSPRFSSEGESPLDIRGTRLNGCDQKRYATPKLARAFRAYGASSR